MVERCKEDSRGWLVDESFFSVSDSNKLGLQCSQADSSLTQPELAGDFSMCNIFLVHTFFAIDRILIVFLVPYDFVWLEFQLVS